MKPLILILFSLFTFNMAQAQYQDDLEEAASDNTNTEEVKTVSSEKAVQWGELTGPEAKNQPVWKYANSQAVAIPSSERAQGPKAKNRKAWEKSDKEQYVPVVTKPRKDLKGPRFKNRKPGS